MSDIKVSVIVPTYNEKKYIRETAGYILNQTFKDIEVIFVDDGSDDGTEEILEEIKASDDRVRVIHQQNQYAGVARNNGLKEAEGDYVVFLDSDDIFSTDMLQEMYEKIVEDEADICFCGAYNKDAESGAEIDTDSYLKEDLKPDHTPFTHEDIDKYLYNFSANIVWNKMYRKQFIIDNNLQFQPLCHVNDIYFVMMSYYYAKVFTYVNKAFVGYRFDNSDSLTNNASKNPLGIYDAYYSVYEALQKEDGFERVSQSFYNKTIRGFFYELTKHNDFNSYEKVYNVLKNEIFGKWNIPEDMEYYSVKDTERIKHLKTSNAIEFLLWEYKKDNKELILRRDKVKKLKKKIENLKKKNEKLRAKNDALNVKQDKFFQSKQYWKNRSNRLENSKEYRLGRKIIGFFRKIKKILFIWKRGD